MDPDYIAAAAAVAIVAVIVLIYVARNGGIAPRRGNGPRIQSPRLGFLNLKGAAGEQLLAEDKGAIASLFSTVLESTSTPPSCDILFIYGDVNPDGSISGTTSGFREIIRDSGACVALVASENPTYTSLAWKTNFGRANLVLTLDRRGSVFADFFSRLFAEMKKGTSMPFAWVKLAPQIPGHDHVDCPGAIFVAEAGHVTFGTA